LVLERDTTPKQVLERLVSNGVVVNRFEVATPSLNDIFLEVAGKSHE
jgi:ABC-2 type transport system ATP-binding protein